MRLWRNQRKKKRREEREADPNVPTTIDEPAEQAVQDEPVPCPYAESPHFHPGGVCPTESPNFSKPKTDSPKRKSKSDSTKSEHHHHHHSTDSPKTSSDKSSSEKSSSHHHHSTDSPKSSSTSSSEHHHHHHHSTDSPKTSSSSSSEHHHHHSSDSPKTSSSSSSEHHHHHSSSDSTKSEHHHHHSSDSPKSSSSSSSSSEHHHHHSSSDSTKSEHHHHHHSTDSPKTSSDKSSSEDSSKSRPSSKKVKNYVSFELTIPEDGKITQAFVDQLFTHYKKGEVLNSKATKYILTEMLKLCSRNESAITDISIPVNGTLVVVGDTHGQLPDFFTIINANGLPSESVLYLFNGDFVDRGSHGLELSILLFTLKLYKPNCIFFNRGNHECASMNEKYSFKSEVIDKHPKSGVALYDLYQDVFCQIPLAAVVSDKIFVTHGGLFSQPDVTLQELSEIDFKRQPPKGELTEREDIIFKELLWSDPQELPGLKQSNRGAGTVFGPDVTLKFLHDNKLDLIIRSHEVQPNGFSVVHNNKLITLFSASNYCGKQNNLGAWITIKNTGEPAADGSNLEQTFHKFSADPVYSATLGIGGYKQDEMKKDTIERLRAKIVSSKSALRKYFKALDIEFNEGTRTTVKSKGLVTITEWAKALQVCTHLSLVPWCTLRHYLVEIRPQDNMIEWSEFLGRHQVFLSKILEESWEDLWMHSITELMFKQKDSLLETIAEFDKDQNGLVDVEEFRQAILKLGVELSSSQVEKMLRKIVGEPKLWEGGVRYKVFMQKFQMTWGKLVEEELEKKGIVGNGILSIGEAIYNLRGDNLKEVFAEFDLNHDGNLSYDEFVQAVEQKLQLDEDYSKEDLLEIAKVLDHTNCGSISWSDFKKEFNVEALDVQWEKGMLNVIIEDFMSNKYGMGKAFTMFDTNGDGVISREEFKAGLEMLDEMMFHQLSTDQMDQLFDVFDKDNSGQIDKDEFMNTLYIIDKH